MTANPTATRPPTSAPRGARKARRPFGPLAVSVVAHGIVLAAGWCWTSSGGPASRPPEVLTLAFDPPDDTTDVAFEALDDVRIDDAPPMPAPEPIEWIEPLFSLPDLPPAPAPPPDVEVAGSDGPSPVEEPLAPSPLPPLAPASAARRLVVPSAAKTPPPDAAPPPAPIVAPPRRLLVEASAPRPSPLPGGAPGATYVVTIEYAIAADGRVTEAVVAASSGWPALDEATRAHLIAAWRYVPPGEPRRASRRFLFRYGSGTGG